MENETIIKDLINQRVEAIRKKNAAAASRHYAASVVLFDVVGPLQHTKPNPVKKRLEEWLGTFRDEIGYEIAGLQIKAGSRVAFCHSLHHISADTHNGSKLDMWWRETLTWEKINNEWLITHAHSSVPFDVNDGKASVGLKP